MADKENVDRAPVLGRSRDRVETLRDDLAYAIRTRDEWEANAEDEARRAEKAETELERLREGVKALAEEWAAEDTSEWHHLHQPDVGRAIEAVKGALVPELRGLLDEDGGA